MRSGSSSTSRGPGRVGFGSAVLAALIAGAALPVAAQQTGVPRGDLAPRAAPAPAPEIRLPQSAPAGPPAGAENTSLTLRDIVIEGATVFSPDDFRGIYGADLGRTVTLARLFEVASLIEARYRETGYVLSRAIIPAQTIEDGTFRIRVIEGFISNVVVEGDIGPVRPLVESYARKITEHRPVNIAEIERYLLLINDIPGITARSIPRAGAGEVGASELLILAQRKWYEGFALLDNRGSKFLGPWTSALGGALNSFTPYGEQTQLVAYGTPFQSEQGVGQLRYRQFLGSEGLKVGGSVSYGRAYPGDSLRGVDVDAETLIVNAEVEYPLIRTRALSLFLTGGFDYIDGETDVIQAPFSEDKLRVLYAGAGLEFRDEWRGVNQLRLALRQGLDILGATDRGDGNRSRVDGQADFTTVGARFSRLQPLFDRVSAYARVEGQYSFDDLLAGEEFAVGGLSYGRGYDPAEISGEHGIGLNLELRFAITELEFLQGLELYGFYDHGEIWNSDASGPSHASIDSAGAGLRIGINDWLAAELELAKALSREPVNRDGKPLRLFLNVTARF